MLASAFGRLYLRLTGWRAEGIRPQYDKYVMVAAPHTTNWDMPNMVGISWSLGVSVNWIGKRELFRFPFGWLMRWMGGVPIDRSKRSNLVAQAAERLKSAQHMVLAVPPEGTRSGGSGYWKSGFYHIAREAGVPIVLGYLDYSRKRGGFGPVVWPTGDVTADMDRIRAFYKAEMAKFRDKFRVPRLAVEDEVPEPLPATAEGTR